MRPELSVYGWPLGAAAGGGGGTTAHQLPPVLRLRLRLVRLRASELAPPCAPLSSSGQFTACMLEPELQAVASGAAAREAAAAARTAAKASMAKAVEMHPSSEKEGGG